MAKRIEHVSGRVKVRDPSQLDSDRFIYLTLDQAEANFGRPDSNGALVISNTSGVRSFTTEPTLSGLSFKIGALDSADSASLYALFLKGSPFDGNIDSVGYRRLDGALLEIDTLDTVTTRGNVTPNPIFVGKITADSAVFGGDVIIDGSLRVNGTTTTLNSTILTINDKNIVLADSAPDALAADSAGITVRGANANIYYKAGTDTWNLDKAVNIDSNLSIGGKFFLGNYDIQKTTLALYVDEITGEIYAGTPAGDSATGANIADQVRIDPAIANAEFYPLFTSTYNGIDSVNADSDFTYNPALNRLTTGRLRLNQLPNQPIETVFLTLDDSNNVGFRDLGGLAVLDSEQDTLHSVTTRGDSTDNAITVRKITTTDSAIIGSNLQFNGALLDAASRRLVIYDSAGAILWG